MFGEGALLLLLITSLLAYFHGFLEVQARNIHTKPRPGVKCRRGNPIDDCWRCANSTWAEDPKLIAECIVGFGWTTYGGKQGRHYLVTSDQDDPVDPKPGTLRHAVIQSGPHWISFASDMVIDLKAELLVAGLKTIDGRGVEVHVTGYGCIILHYVGHVIIHSIHVHGCKPGPPTRLMVSPGIVRSRGGSDGDGITVFGSRDVWIDHCSLSNCTDGLIDVLRNSTRVTLSNNYFKNHDKVMLLGANDEDESENSLEVTVAYNHFGENLGQRMPRCRHGQFHIVNNYYSNWSHYAVGGTARPSILSQGNIYVAPNIDKKKEVTSRNDARDESDDWKGWNWLSLGDELDNGAFFTPSGSSDLSQYKLSVDPQPSSQVMEMTADAGALRCWRGEHARCTKGKG